MQETELSKNLKTLEGQTFRTMTALFKSLENAGVQLPKGYGSGTRNILGGFSLLSLYKE